MEKRRRIEEGYKSALNELKKKSHFGGPDYEVVFVKLKNGPPSQKLCSSLKTVPLLLAGGAEQPHQ